MVCIGVIGRSSATKDTYTNRRPPNPTRAWASHILLCPADRTSMNDCRLLTVNMFVITHNNNNNNNTYLITLLCNTLYTPLFVMNGCYSRTCIGHRAKVIDDVINDHLSAPEVLLWHPFVENIRCAAYRVNIAMQILSWNNEF